MNLSDANDALQRATRPGEWVYWKGGDAYLANPYLSARIGRADDGLESLLAELPRCEAWLDNPEAY